MNKLLVKQENSTIKSLQRDMSLRCWNSRECWYEDINRRRRLALRKSLRWPAMSIEKRKRKRKRPSTEKNLTERLRCVRAGEEARSRKGLRKPCCLHASRPSTFFVDQLSTHLPRGRSGTNQQRSGEQRKSVPDREDDRRTTRKKARRKRKEKRTLFAAALG